MTDKSATHPYLNVGGRVLAAIDLSVYTESTCHYAAWAAHRLEAPLEYLHVLSRHQEAASGIDFSGNLAADARQKLLQDLVVADEHRSKLAQERGRLVLERAKGIAAGLHGVSAEGRLRHGSLVETLTELETDVRLFVLGKRGEHADFAKGHLGGELERVVRAVHRPLLVASREYTEIDRVLIAFDGSPTTRKGVEMVAASPLFRGLEIRVVTAGTDTDAIAKQMQWALETLKAAGLTALGAILSGDPEDIIASYVRDEEVDLLVMGAYGHSRIRQLIVGSTTTTMLRTCRVPVLLLR
ncbi:universal stress protein [Luteimonas salinilitoris]|uniref:Universal stress protein n=1 Tax=Luteimonas salinilitoris TaxID=3237697 RepID=A0ABV4HVU0_9GAMM